MTEAAHYTPHSYLNTPVVRHMCRISLEFHYHRTTQPKVENCFGSRIKLRNHWNVHVHIAIHGFYLNFHQAIFILYFILTGTLSTRMSSNGDASNCGMNDVLLLNTDSITSDGNSSSRSTCMEWIRMRDGVYLRCL